jgi:Tfp pilus assembly protein PilX
MTARNPERGSAMLVTLIIIAALLAGAVVLVSMQLSANRSTDLARSSTSALYCAEAGLHAARRHVANATLAERNGALAQSASGDLTEPAFLQALITSHDLDGDGIDDFHVYLRDNDDEVAAGSAANDRAVDIDNQIWMVSVCDKYPETPKAVSELVNIVERAGALYDWQAGGAMGNNNYNFQNTTY